MVDSVDFKEAIHCLYLGSLVKELIQICNTAKLANLGYLNSADNKASCGVPILE